MCGSERDRAERVVCKTMPSVDTSNRKTKRAKRKECETACVTFNQWFRQRLYGAEAGMYKWGCPSAEEATTPPLLSTETLLQEKTSRSSMPGG